MEADAPALQEDKQVPVLCRARGGYLPTIKFLSHHSFAQKIVEANSGGRVVSDACLCYFWFYKICLLYNQPLLFLKESSVSSVLCIYVCLCACAHFIPPPWKDLALFLPWPFLILSLERHPSSILAGPSTAIPVYNCCSLWDSIAAVTSTLHVYNWSQINAHSVTIHIGLSCLVQRQVPYQEPCVWSLLYLS